ncbi:ribonuclease E activity regulator RraA [Neorhizobium sp. T786]|uniref:ribonuclease E activity regulator RraA n=1 Tax=Pseudorhizobium xiangyangii TaxID=2883104 RepID=UPI001CFFFB0A|nr:ribonuclease E activity regulator RraA [Neorhizobium xiangyangii]MCB5204582.1 ribonuclease E activity regulator RraA [Neorhizobium xiangyangii]
MTNSLKTADLVDTNDTEVRFCEMQWKSFGSRNGFHGEIVTIRTFEDNRLLRETLEGDGHGKVLVVDGGGSLRCALVGDLIAALGQANGWQGILINGAIRDSADLAGMDFCVMALGQSPKKSGKTGHGIRGVPVRFGNVEFATGQYIYADGDGVLVADRPVHG